MKKACKIHEQDEKLRAIYNMSAKVYGNNY